MSPHALNMFGVPPCPKCGSEFRVLEPERQAATEREYREIPTVICCDDCGFTEPLRGVPPTEGHPK